MAIDLSQFEDASQDYEQTTGTVKRIPMSEYLKLDMEGWRQRLGTAKTGDDLRAMLSELPILDFEGPPTELTYFDDLLMDGSEEGQRLLALYLAELDRKSEEWVRT